ncbi:hypothetical protein [Actinocorallia longicatena]
MRFTVGFSVVAAFCASAPEAASGEPASPEPSEATVIAVATDARLDNASGLALSTGGSMMFTLQDARRSTLIYALDMKGRTAFTVALPAGGNEDWEDLATATLSSGRRVMMISDTGDAFQVRQAARQGYRKTFRLITFDEPKTSTRKATGVTIQSFRYPDNATRNVETLLLQPGTGRPYLVTKTQPPAEGSPGKPGVTEVWTLPPDPDPASVVVARKVTAGLPVTAASGGAFSPSGDRLVIRNGLDAFVWWVEDGDVPGALATEPVKIHLPPQRQGEGVAFTASGHSLIVNSEGVRQPLWQVPLPRSADASAEPSEGGEEPRKAGLGGRLPAAIIAVVMLAGGAGILVYKFRTRVR